MKKLFPSLLAIISVLWLTLALSSCVAEVYVSTPQVAATWSLHYNNLESTPDEVIKEQKAVATQMERRTEEIFGKTIFLEQIAVGDSLKPSREGLRVVYDRFRNDYGIQSYIQLLRSINDKYKKKYLISVDFYLHAINFDGGETTYL